MSENDSGKTRQKKSPSFPYIDIREAINHAEQLSKGIGFTSEIPALLAMKRLGMNPKSSTSKRSIGTMLDYGLLEDRGGAGQDKQVRLSELARRIIVDKRIGSTERLAAIREATLNDDMMRRAWEFWKYDLPQDNQAIETVLRLNWDFSDRASSRFLTVIRGNYRHAELHDYFESNGVSPSEPMQHQGHASTDHEMSTLQSLQAGYSEPLQAADFTEIHLPLRGGKKIVSVRVPRGITEDEFDALITMLQVTKIGLIAGEGE